MFESTRDSLIKKALQEHPTIKRLGTVHALSLNTNERTCSLEVGLSGEPFPIRFSARYEISNVGDGAEIVLSEIHSEKRWMDELLKIFLEEKGGNVKFPVSGLAARLMRMFL